MPVPVTINAWTGSEAASCSIPNPAAWALRREIESAPRLLAPDQIDYLNWREEGVGWGVILADGANIPPPLQALIDERKGPVFRYNEEWAYRFLLLRNEKAGKDISINGAPRGTAPDALPYYLLIHGSPAEVPWQLQYILNANRCVGRLDLVGPALENYINALLTGDWTNASTPKESANQNRAVIWAVSFGEDITELMRNAIAARLAEHLRKDDQLRAGTIFIDGANGSAQAGDLADALASSRPGLVVTTSHGMTGPLEAEFRSAMHRNLGLPVDSTEQVLTPDSILEKWQPAGAIWYAHACCSAGGDDESSFADLIDSQSTAGQVLAAVASLGAQVAPLPTALLGVKRPLRAFIGHVEPTFDWTLRENATGQFLTDGIVKALYQNLYVKQGDATRPVGYAFREWYGRTNVLRAQFDQAKTQLNIGGSTEDLLLALQLVARDVESTVILGDPTVAMPGLE